MQKLFIVFIFQFGGISPPMAGAGLKGREPGAIFTGGSLWRNSWRHRL